MTGMLCPDCNREVTPELVKISDVAEIVQRAAAKEQGFMPVTEGSATIRLSCGCGHVDLQAGPLSGSSAWSFPDAWRDAVDPVATDGGSDVPPTGQVAESVESEFGRLISSDSYKSEDAQISGLASDIEVAIQNMWRDTRGNYDPTTGEYDDVAVDVTVTVTRTGDSE